MSFFRVENLSKTFSKNKVRALHNISFSCEEKSITSLMGSSGSGKSTLLSIIAGLDFPDCGNITLNGRKLNGNLNYIKPEQRDIGIIFQDLSLFPNMTIEQNLYYGNKTKQNKSFIKDLINLTKIEDLMRRYPHEISGGQAQRVAIIRSLGNRPSLLLMDEPLSQLDIKLKEEIRDELILIFKNYDMTVIIATHDMYDVFHMSHKTLLLKDGAIEQYDKSLNILKDPISEYSSLIFGYSNNIPQSYFPEIKNYFQSSDNKKYISIRPEQFKLKSETSDFNRLNIKCEIIDVINIGYDRILKLSYKDKILIAKLPDGPKVKIGEIKYFSIIT